MSKNKTVVEFSEPLALAGLEEQWNHGDHFALVEAIAICHVNDWPFPEWATNHIGTTMADIFQCLFPQRPLNKVDTGEGKTTFIPRHDEDLASRFKEASKHAIRRLGLRQQGTSVVEKSRIRRRDLQLVFLVAEECRYDPSARNVFVGIEIAKEKIARTISEARDKRVTPNHIPPECMDATEAVIDHAWKRYGGFVKEAYAGLPADAPSDPAAD